MQYIILENGKEYGPIEQETLQKWVEHGRILPDTQVRNALIKKWNKAKDLEFLKLAFAVQAEKREKDAGLKDKLTGLLHFLPWKKKEADSPKKTAFRHEYIHGPANVFQRVFAAVFDIVLIFIFAIIVFFTGVLAVGAGYDVNAVFDKLFIVSLAGILLYYGVSLGVYAQTVGMWFWGLMIVKNNNGEVFLGRAYLFSLLMIIFGIISPFIVYINPSRRSLHDILSGTKIIRIAATPKV